MQPTDTDLKAILSESFVKANTDLVNTAKFDTNISGSTAVMTLIREDKMICANLGDSRAVVGRLHGNQWEAIPVTNDHKPTDPSEHARITKAGGVVAAAKNYDGESIGPPRVWVNNSYPPTPGLAMTRSLGDQVGSWAGVIATPEITEHTLIPDDKFIILASDGVWEFLSNQ
jgi:serine/threonine protein phosphatase PrpC